MTRREKDKLRHKGMDSCVSYDDTAITVDKDV